MESRVTHLKIAKWRQDCHLTYYYFIHIKV